MLLHRLDDALSPHDRKYYEPSELSSGELLDVDRTGAEEAWYWYATGSYEGDGHMLLRFGGGWAATGLGHCSCNGPTDSLPDEPTHNTLKSLAESYTAEYLRDLAPLLKMAKGGDDDLHNQH